MPSLLRIFRRRPSGCTDHPGLVCFCDEERDRRAGIHRASGLDDGFGGYLCVCGGGRYSATLGCMATDPLVHCQRCTESMPPPQLLDHVRIMHPDVDVEPVEDRVQESGS
jgi:hypothetical protein